MFYVGLGDYGLNIETSMKNLLTNLEPIDYIIVIDNSLSGGEIVLEADGKTINYRATSIPTWVKAIEQQLHRAYLELE